MATQTLTSDHVCNGQCRENERCSLVTSGPLQEYEVGPEMARHLGSRSFVTRVEAADKRLRPNAANPAFSLDPGLVETGPSDQRRWLVWWKTERV